MVLRRRAPHARPGVVGLLVLLLTLGGILAMSHCSPAGGQGNADPTAGVAAMGHGPVTGFSDQNVPRVSAPSGPAAGAVDPGPAGTGSGALAGCVLVLCGALAALGFRAGPGHRQRVHGVRAAAPRDARRGS
jgi:hypothetical protein